MKRKRGFAQLLAAVQATPDTQREMMMIERLMEWTAGCNSGR
jgi:hypothetical protein